MQLLIEPNAFYIPLVPIISGFLSQFYEEIMAWQINCTNTKIMNSHANYSNLTIIMLWLFGVNNIIKTPSH